MTTETDRPVRTPDVHRATTRSSALRRWHRRRPMRKSLVWVHRWTALVLGLLLVIETTTGVVLLWNNEIFRATHSSFYAHTASSQPISQDQALARVQAAHPNFTPAWVSADHGIYVVGDPAYATAYPVDPGTGRVGALTNLDGGVMGLLVNIHDCALTCEGYPGTQSWLVHPMLTFGWSGLADITWGSFLLIVLGLLMVLLAISGVITWWPGRRHLSKRVKVRTGRGRYVRDYDLHNIVGIVAVPMLFLWGLTGAAIESPQIENAWLQITGGHDADPALYAFTPANTPAGATDIGLAGAIAVAQQQYDGRPTYTSLPTKQTPYYGVSLSGGYSAYQYRNFYGGDVTVYVNAKDASDTKLVNIHHGATASNTFYDSAFEPMHFGWLVNPWWRIFWGVLGTAPLVLMLTGISTWLARGQIRRRRRAARSDSSGGGGSASLAATSA